MNYLDNINAIVETKIISKEEIFNYYDTPQETLFNGFYNFCSETLDKQRFSQIAKPSLLYYKNDTTINASASRINQTCIIEINSGLFIWAIQKLYQNEKLTEAFQGTFPDLTSRLDVPVSELCFQIATQFTFYHELGHLIQMGNSKNEQNFQETYKDSNFSLTQHNLEMNADSFAGICVATHLLQYFERIFNDDINEELFNKAMVVAGTCLFSYFLELSVNKNEIYFYEKSHPHPYIRLFNSLMHILNYLTQSEHLKSKGIQVEMSKLAKVIVNFYLILEKESVFKTTFNKVFNDAFDKQKEVIDYINHMNEFNVENYNNAINHWNNTMGTAQSHN